MANPSPIPTDPPSYDARGNLRTKRLKLDPDLADGEHWTIADGADAVLVENIRTWMLEAAEGDEITLKIVAMSDAEADALPQI